MTAIVGLWLSYSRHRDRINLGLSVAITRGGGGGLFCHFVPIRRNAHILTRSKNSDNQLKHTIHAHWEVKGRGSLPRHHLVSDSANPHYVSDPRPLWDHRSTGQR